MVEASLGTDFAHRLQHPGDARARELGGQGRLDPGDGHEGHRRQVVDLIWLGGPHGVHERALVEQIALVQDDAVADVLDAVELLGGGASHHPVYVVAVLEEQFGEVGPVLTGDPGDERGAFVVHGRGPYLESLSDGAGAPVCERGDSGASASVGG